MDPHLTEYIFRHYGHLKTEKERLAHRHLFGTEKAARGRSDEAAQEDAKKSKNPYLREMLSNDAKVLALARGGFESFKHKTAQRICDAHSKDMYINHCPQCGEVAIAAKARQCRFCRHDWHEPAGIVTGWADRKESFPQGLKPYPHNHIESEFCSPSPLKCPVYNFLQSFAKS